jgi:hypothetical protein
MPEVQEKTATSSSMKTNRILKHGMMGLAMAILTALILMMVIGVSSLFGVSPPALKGTSEAIAKTSWVEAVINSVLPAEYVTYTPTIISASVLVTLISLPLLFVYRITILKLLYEYTYSSSLFGVTIVGVKALITSLISGAIFLVVDNALELGSGLAVIILLLVAKWILWGWIARNVTGVRIKGWS